MKRCTKDVEIELSNGITVEAKLKVTGMYDDLCNADTNSKDVQGAWLVDSWKTEHDVELDEDEEIEFNEKVEEIVFEEKWDFENSGDSDDEEEDEVE